MKKLQHVQNSSETISKKRESGVTKRFSVLTSFLWSLRVWDIICCPFVFLPYFNFELKFLTSVSG